MIVELHIIQNFAPANLNRDDSNTPKDCEFGGYRRARISSQCIKRSVRRHPAFSEAVKKAGGHTGIRTKRLKKRLEEVFAEKYGRDPSEAEKAAVAAIELLGFKLSEADKTEYLLYLGENEIDEIADTANSVWDQIQKADFDEKEGKKKTKSLSGELKKVQGQLVSVVSKSRKAAKSYAADIALYGRMVADNKNMSVDAACQVAHAISTHKIEMEMDYFTAVDDLLPGEDSGSDMIGVVEFNSSCFYRYSLVDINKLRSNLGLNGDLLKAAITGYLEASIKAVPTGMQNSMAAQNPPSYARVIVRKDGFPWALTNAFQKPVRSGREKSLDEESIIALEGYFEKLAKVYGQQSFLCDVSLNLYDPESKTMGEMIESVSAALA
jgi:CRISPR system Cascade subunit CasC